MTSRMHALFSKSSDGHVLFATIVIGAMAACMLVIQLIDTLHLAPSYDRVLGWTEIVAEIAVILAIAWAGPLALREMDERRRTSILAEEGRSQIEALFKMTDMLQSAIGYDDANAVLRATAARLLPDFGGALYVFNNSGDRLELSTQWSWPESSEPAKTVAPSSCWALKRGKLHLNSSGLQTLRCEHQEEPMTVLEIPMMARGEVYGLLLIQASGENAERRLHKSVQISGALADAMSLTLSNIALREKLRTQALRDPLTGLYNRRYMEDALERYANLAERNKSALTVVMFDLDHFKRLNDEHGHALGDCVLTDVAAAVIGAIRPSDVACRYGGEEFVVLFPECTLAEGLVKAEVLRSRIEQLSQNHGARISGSFGIATIPETSAKGKNVIADADAALYRAKADGRNRVVSATDRPVHRVAIRAAQAA